MRGTGAAGVVRSSMSRLPPPARTRPANEDTPAINADSVSDLATGLFRLASFELGTLFGEPGLVLRPVLRVQLGDGRPSVSFGGSCSCRLIR